MPVALKATLSQRPETRQLMRSGQSAWVREMSSRTWASQPRRRGLEGDGDEAWWAAAMEAAKARLVGLDGLVMFGVLMPELGPDGCGVSRGVAEAMVTGSASRVRNTAIDGTGKHHKIFCREKTSFLFFDPWTLAAIEWR